MAIIKQYVNLPSGTTNIHGRTRDLRLTPSSVPNVGPGDRVEWWIEPDPGNTNVSYLSLAQRASLRSPQTGLSGSGAFENQLTLPHVGGDKYKVRVSKLHQRANFLETDTFETWRKLYYSVFYMGNAALNMFNGLEADFKAAFAAGFVELENVQKTAALTVMARVDLSTAAAIGRPNFHFLGGTAAPGGIVDLRPTGTGALAHKPFHVAIIVVPDIYRIQDVAKTFTIALASIAGSTTVDFRLFQKPGDPKAFVYQGTVSWPSHAGVDIKPKLFLQGAPTNYLSRYRWDLRTVPGLTTWLATAGHTASIDLSLVKESPGIMGYSIYNLVVVRTIDGTTDVLQTFTHEVGHGIRQTVQSEPKFTGGGTASGSEANPRWHTDNFGGRGNHCSTNATLSTAAPLPPGLTSVFRYGGAGDLCTMYYAGESHVEPKGKFCATACLPRVKRVNLDSTSMNLRWNQIG
jgi:hypothetical protein